MKLRFWQRKPKGRSKEWLAGYAAGRRARNRGVPAGTTTVPGTGIPDTDFDWGKASDDLAKQIADAND